MFVKDEAMVGDLGSSVVATDVARLARLREERRPQERGSPQARRAAAMSQSTRWELRVQVGGPLEELVPPELPLAAVGELGPAVAGVGYIEVGADMLLPVADGHEPDSRSKAFVELARIQERVHNVVREQCGLDIPDSPDGTVERNDFAWSAEESAGRRVRPARTRTALLLGATAEGLLPVESLAAALPPGHGRPWASYGVARIVERSFPTHQPPGSAVWYPLVDHDFWVAVSEALEYAAAAIGLPDWPRHSAELVDQGSGRKASMAWASAWSRPR